MVMETFEAVEISSPVDESPAVLWAAVAAGAVAAAALTLVAATEGGYVRDSWNPGLTGR